MSKIVVTYNGLIQQEVEVDKPRLNIGRRRTNDIIIDHLTVSGQHATIDTTNQGSFILDLGSTNGTTVNGQPIKKHLLEDDDVIEVGKYKLQFKFAPRVIPPAPPPSPPATKVENTSPPTTGFPRTSPNKEASVANGKLKVLNGTNAGKEMPLNKPITTLGRPGVLVISITKQHQGYTIAHVDGNNVPKLNDQAMGLDAYQLRHGDVIDMAGTRMEFVVV